MINKKELRIGNYFKYGEKTFTVLGINNNVVLANSNRGKIDFGIESIEAIAITEEWLIKFGFVQSDGDLFELTIKKDDSCISDLWCRSESGLKISLNVSDRITEEQADLKFEYLKYVHQLQNLYFALTNEEL